MCTDAAAIHCMGRYFYYRLHPFSLAECIGKINSLKPQEEIEIADAPAAAGKTLDALIKFGGFPEPFLKQSERDRKTVAHTAIRAPG